MGDWKESVELYNLTRYRRLAAALAERLDAERDRGTITPYDAAVLALTVITRSALNMLAEIMPAIGDALRDALLDRAEETISAVSLVLSALANADTAGCDASTASVALDAITDATVEDIVAYRTKQEEAGGGEA